MKNFNATIWNRTSNLPICSTALIPVVFMQLGRVYYADDDDDMFWPLWAIFRSQKCIMKTIQSMIISRGAYSKLSTRQLCFYVTTLPNPYTVLRNMDVNDKLLAAVICANTVKYLSTNCECEEPV